MERKSELIADRLAMIRKHHGITRAKFAELVETTPTTINKIERHHQRPRADILAAVAERWPEYAYWLLTGKTDAAAGHISPEIEAKRAELGTQKAAG